MARPLMTSEQRAIAEAYMTNESIKSIAERFDRSPTTVGLIANRLGLRRRRRPRVPRMWTCVVIDKGEQDGQ